MTTFSLKCNNVNYVLIVLIQQAHDILIQVPQERDFEHYHDCENEIQYFLLLRSMFFEIMV